MLKRFLLFFLICLPLFSTAQTKVWNPVRPSGVADNSSLWNNPANWTPAGIPASTDSVVIASGTNTCLIDAVNFFTPQCRVLVIQNNAAVYNKSSLADIGGPLTISQDLIIRSGGYYFSEAKIVEIGRDLWIQGGTPGGSFIVRDNTNEIRIGRHFANEGALAKRQITATFLNVRFTSNTNAFIWASNTAPLHNRTRNTFESEDISARAGFAYSYLIGTPFTVLKTGAFDNILVDKNLATIQNSGVPGGTHPNWTLTTTNIFLPFLAGIVGDGVSDFDGNATTDPRNTLFLVGSGKLEISRGTVIVNNVRNTSIGGRALTIVPVDPNDFRVYDNTTTNPRGRAWIVPAPDINIRGDITISDANFGAPSYNGASLDLFTGTPRDSICLHIGGTLTDNNVQEPSQSVGQRRGFYIGSVDNLFNPAAISATTTNNPIVVFNGTVGQNINGPLSGGIQLRDYNNIPNQGSGIVLPNVYVFKPNGSTVSIGGGSNVRILGDLNIFAGTFSLNGRRLIFGDQSSDEINVLSLGNVANPNPDFSGVFEVAAGSNLVMASSSGAIGSGELDRGAILRVRRGGRANFSGTPAQPITFDRDSRIGGRTRIGVYSGGFFSARFTTFTFMSPRNTGNGNTIGYSITTNTPTDANYNTEPSGAYTEGGLKLFPGSIAVQTSVAGASPAVGDAFSDCAFNSTNGNVNLTIDTDLALDFGSSTVTTRSFTIYNTEFSGRSDQNRNCISKNNLLPRVVTFIDSKGTIGGIFGEDNDDDAGSSTGAVDARIVWQNAPLARWNGSVSTSWNNWQNWDVPNDSDPARVGDNGGTANNLDRLIPGVSTFTRTNVIIPRSAARNCVQDVNVSIVGTLVVNERNTGTDKTLTIQSGASRTTNVANDVVVEQGGTWNLGDATISLQGGLNAAASTNTTTVNTAETATIIAGTSTIIFNAPTNQFATIRHNALNNVRINKPSALLIVTGYQSGGPNNIWTFRLNADLTIQSGTIRFQSNTPVDIAGNFIQTGGGFEPLASQVTIRGNFDATGGSFSAGSSTVQFYPRRNTSTLKTIRTTSNHNFNRVVFADGDNIDLTSNDPNIMQAGRERLQQGYMLIRMEDAGSAPLQRNHRYELVAGIADSTAASAGAASRFTYNLLSDLTIIGQLDVYSKRTLLNRGFALSVGNTNLFWNATLTINSSNIRGGELRVAPGSTITTFSNANVNLIGTTSNYVKLTRNGVSGAFGFTMGGIISARYFISEFTDQNGIYLTSTARQQSPGLITTGGGGRNYTNPEVNITPLFAGSGGAITANIGGTPLTAIVVTDGGSGYTSTPPTVSFSSGAATATSVVEGSPITTVALTDGGEGYTSVPTVTINNAGTGGTGLALTPIMALNRVNNVVVNTPGTGYTTPPAVSFAAGGGTGASAVAVLEPSGLAIQTITMANVGSGYTAPMVSIIGFGGTGSGASATANVSLGQIISIDVVTNGSGYVLPIQVIITDPDGDGAVANTTLVSVFPAVGVQSVEIADGGQNYAASFAVNFTGGGGTGAAATATAAGGEVIGLSITNFGSGYFTVPTITFSGGGATTQATAVATTRGGFVTAINLGAGGSYTALPTVTIAAPPVGGTTATAIAEGDGGVITSFTVTDPGIGFQIAPQITVFDNGGIGSGASARAKLNPGPVVAINVLSGGTGYLGGGSGTITAPDLQLLTANGDGAGATASATVVSGAITAISIISPGAGYTTAPLVRITGSGVNANAVALISPSGIASVSLTPLIKFPVASFSDGIFTNSAYGAVAAALTFDGTFSFHRTTNPPPSTGWNTGAGDWNYAVAISATAGPRIDTIYNTIFAKNPALDVGGGDFTLSKNIRRVGTNNDLRNRIFFKDAIGTFSGDDFDAEHTTLGGTAPANIVAAANAGAPDPTFLNPFGLANNDSMIVWRQPNVKRWDGGPDNLGTAWSDPANWRPDGVPRNFQDVILDYTFLNVNYATNPPTLVAPSPFNITMDYNYVPIDGVATAKSLIINPLILPRIAGGTATNQPITVNINNANFRIGGTISIGTGGTLNNQIGGNGIIEIGESWSNNGIFIANNGLVRFYKNASRTITNVLSTKDGTDNLILPTNGFARVNFAAGATNLSTDMLATGRLTIGNGATLLGAGRFIYLNSDWINNGTFTPGNGTVYFRGGTLQNITKTETPAPVDARSLKENFFNLTINTLGNSTINNINHVRLNNRVEVVNGGRIRFINGRILSSTNREMIIAEGATIDGPPSRNSFVQGPLGRIFSSSTTPTSLNYPVGSEVAYRGATFTITGLNNVAPAVDGIGTVTINTAGSGYSVGQRLVFNSVNGSGADVRVSAVNGTGGVTAVNIVSSGNNYVISETGDVVPGQNSAIYVGNSAGSVGLNELRLAAAKQTMFVAEQIEGPSPSTRAIPPSEIFNFISTSRHWRIRNLPYVANGDISAADNSNYRLTRLSLWFDAPSEIISGNVANTIFSDLLQLRIVKDSIGTWNAALSNDINVVNPTYNDATTHENRAKLGTAHPGTLWRNVDTGGGIEDINQNAIQAESDLLGINSPGGFGDGTFALAFNYTALPISFLDLEATLNANKEVQLRWTAGNQNPTEKFVLERSFDASLFRTLGEVASRPFDPNTNLQVYSYTDKQPQSGMNYYKVQQVTTNRQDKSSRIVSVNVENGEVFIIYPNPVEKGGLLSIASSAQPGEEVEVSLVDISGRVVLQRATRATGEPLIIKLDNNLSDGVYVVRLKTESKTYQAKIVIQ